MPNVLQITMLAALFVAGLCFMAAGLWIILRREYQETLRALSSQSGRISTKSLVDIHVQSTLDGAARLIEALTRLLQTALGTGVFLCLLGALLSVASVWLTMLGSSAR